MIEFLMISGKSETNEKPIINSGFVRLTDEEIISVIRQVYSNLHIHSSKEDIITVFGTNFGSESSDKVLGNTWKYEYFKNYSASANGENKNDIELLKERNLGIKLTIKFNEHNLVHEAEMLYVMGKSNIIYKVSFNSDGTVNETIIN
ncbi:MAG: hypothetical protein K0S34_1502 [Bacillales bacterium]|nr:hypothetical protein [Bacillales bacterium]